MLETFTTDTEIIEIETRITRRKRIVDFSEITTRVEYDQFDSRAPWEDCDGWEHEVVWSPSTYDYEGLEHRQGYGWSDANRGRFLLSIDDDDIIKKWGFTRLNGESKQVWRERVARVKAGAIEQLKKWYTNGWQWYGGIAEYGDYEESCWGCESEEWAMEVAQECALEVAYRMEEDGYTITNKPVIHQQTPVERMRYNIKHNLNDYL